MVVLPAFGIYAYFMASGMQMLGQIQLFPALILGLLCIMTLLSSVPLANGTIFAFKDYDLIMSLPVKPREVAASRLLLGYVLIALFDLMIILDFIVTHVGMPVVGKRVTKQCLIH